MNSRTPQLQRGFLCECHVNENCLGTFDAYSTREAVRWVRVSLMMVAMSLDEEPYQQARRWLDHGQTEAANALAEGRAHTLVLKQRTTVATWTVRPVLHLPVLTGNTPPHEARA